MRIAHEHRVAGCALRGADRPAVRAMCFDRLLPCLARHGLLAGQPVVMNDAQSVRVDVFRRQRQHRCGGWTEQRGVLAGPGVQAVRKRPDQGAELRRLLGRPLRGLLRNARGSHPPVAGQVGVAVEFRPAAARLRIQANEQLGMAFHLRVSVRMEQARMVRGEDVRDAVGVPQDLRPLLGSRCGPRASVDRKERQRDGEGGPGANERMPFELLHGVCCIPPRGTASNPFSRTGQRGACQNGPAVREERRP